MEDEPDEEENCNCEPPDNYWICWSVFWVCLCVVFCFAFRGCTEYSVEHEKTLQMKIQQEKTK